jgi:hypothetical protein
MLYQLSYAHHRQCFIGFYAFVGFLTYSRLYPKPNGDERDVAHWIQSRPTSAVTQNRPMMVT